MNLYDLIKNKHNVIAYGKKRDNVIAYKSKKIMQWRIVSKKI